MQRIVIGIEVRKTSIMGIGYHSILFDLGKKII